MSAHAGTLHADYTKFFSTLDAVNNHDNAAGHTGSSEVRAV